MKLRIKLVLAEIKALVDEQGDVYDVMGSKIEGIAEDLGRLGREQYLRCEKDIETTTEERYPTVRYHLSEHRKRELEATFHDEASSQLNLKADGVRILLSLSGERESLRFLMQHSDDFNYITLGFLKSWKILKYEDAQAPDRNWWSPSEN